MIYTSRTGAAGMLLDIKLYNGKFKIVSFVVKFRLNRQSMSISMSTCRSRYENDLSVHVISSRNIVFT